jgi:hypothetical protein
MNVNVTPMPEPKPAAEEPKRRIITLTNRAPIQIVEDDWPVVAQGTCGDPGGESPYSWRIEVRVREGQYGRMIIHANYEAEGVDDSDYARVRVGRITAYHPPITSEELWKQMLAVGEELRDRIVCPKHKNWVTQTLDNCFASLKPLTY